MGIGANVAHLFLMRSGVCEKRNAQRPKSWEQVLSPLLLMAIVTKSGTLVNLCDLYAYRQLPYLANILTRGCWLISGTLISGNAKKGV